VYDPPAARLRAGNVAFAYLAKARSPEGFLDLLDFSLGKRAAHFAVLSYVIPFA
jgi:hypothetical protein